jgi:hypothetical protein
MASGAVKGVAAASVGAGVLLVFAGIEGKSVLSTLQGLVQGKPPSTAASANQISVPSVAAIENDTGSSVDLSGGSEPTQNLSSSGVANCISVGQYMMQNGYNRAGAAGIAGCVYGESGGNPESVQNGKDGDPSSNPSGGGGLIQWTPISAYPGLVTGNAAADFKTQLQAIIAYNNGQGSALTGVMKSGFTDPLSAADYYSQKFERPAVTNSDVNAAVATLVYAALI